MKLFCRGRVRLFFHFVGLIDDLLRFPLCLLCQFFGDELMSPVALRRDPRHLQFEVFVLRVVVHRMDTADTKQLSAIFRIKGPMSHITRRKANGHSRGFDQSFFRRQVVKVEFLDLSLGLLFSFSNGDSAVPLCMG